MNITCDLNGFGERLVDNDILYIATLSHNNPNYIREFIRLNTKYISCQKKIVVFDTSRDNDLAFKIRGICEDNNILYNRLRIENLEDELQTRIGLKMNFIYNFYFKTVNVRYGGFLQSDFFI